MPDPDQHKLTDQRRIVVVGPCASGKSTLVRNLRNHGFDAYACAQEHSAVPRLWAHQEPDVVIALRTGLETIRKRRGAEWSETIYEAQMHRLHDAYEAAGLTIDTSDDDESGALQRAIVFLEHAVVKYLAS